MQRINHEAGVVGDGSAAGGVEDSLCLEVGVLFKRRAGLLYVEIDAVFAFQRDLHPELPQNCIQFEQLVLVFAR